MPFFESHFGGTSISISEIIHCSGKIRKSRKSRRIDKDGKNFSKSRQFQILLKNGFNKNYKNFLLHSLFEKKANWPLFSGYKLELAHCARNSLLHLPKIPLKKSVFQFSIFHFSPKKKKN